MKLCTIVLGSSIQFMHGSTSLPLSLWSLPFIIVNTAAAAVTSCGWSLALTSASPPYTTTVVTVTTGAFCLQVYYITCPNVTINFAHFNATPTAREVTLIEQTTGKCVDHAEEIDTPTYLCKGDGKWYLPTGGCKCKPGYEADFEKQQCMGKLILVLYALLPIR